MEIVVYQTKKVESSKTHEDTIDIELFANGGRIRVFLSRSTATELIHKMLVALSTPFQKEEESQLM